MKRRSGSRRAFEAAVACLLLGIPCGAAVAADPVADEEVRQTRTSREILLHEDPDLEAKNSWPSPNFHLHRKSGLGYSKKMKWGDRALVFRLRGPVMRKQKALGLKFKLNF